MTRKISSKIKELSKIFEKNSQEQVSKRRGSRIRQQSSRIRKSSKLLNRSRSQLQQQKSQSKQSQSSSSSQLSQQTSKRKHRRGKPRRKVRSKSQKQQYQSKEEEKEKKPTPPVYYSPIQLTTSNRDKDKDYWVKIYHHQLQFYSFSDRNFNAEPKPKPTDVIPWTFVRDFRIEDFKGNNICHLDFYQGDNESPIKWRFKFKKVRDFKRFFNNATKWGYLVYNSRLKIFRMHGHFFDANLTKLGNKTLRSITNKPSTPGK